MNSFNPLWSNSKFGARRKARGWSQRLLADQIGTSQTIVFFWEKGTYSPAAEWLPRIADTLNCSTIDLLQRPPKTLREYRYAAGLDQTTLAEKVGVHPGTVSRIERAGTGPREAAVRKRWAKAIGLSEAEWLEARAATKAEADKT